MCQVHTGAYVTLLAPGKTDYTACHLRKTTTYISHVVPITTHTHDRRKPIGKKKQIMKIRYRDIGKERQESKKRKSKGRKEKTRSEKRQDKERKRGKEKRENVILADPRN